MQHRLWQQGSPQCALATMEERSPGMEAKQQAQEDKQLAGDKVEDLKYWEGVF